MFQRDAFLLFSLWSLWFRSFKFPSIPKQKGREGGIDEQISPSLHWRCHHNVEMLLLVIKLISEMTYIFER